MTSQAAPSLTRELLRQHFGGDPLSTVVFRRQFPDHLKLEIQASIAAQLAPVGAAPLGIHQRHQFMGLTIAGLSSASADPNLVAPLQYQDMDVGDDRPASCLVNGLWLFTHDGTPIAVLFAQHFEGPKSVVAVEIALPRDGDAASFAETFFARIAADAAQSTRYRGKVLSLDSADAYSGLASPTKVHRLERRERSEVVLPDHVLRMVDEHIFDFEARKERLKRHGQSLRKGVLFHGPPGTGKTHLIRYIMSNLPSRTSILMLGAAVGQIARYMELARTLQPSLVVIEDVDLIGRSRETITHPGVEATLNTILNEMDGLGDDADILFILTTNRPEELEAALALRPGRVDEAIEVPLPDDHARARLIALYGGTLDLPVEIVRSLVESTSGVTASFIKELVRRLVIAAPDDGDRLTIDRATADGIVQAMLAARTAVRGSGR